MELEKGLGLKKGSRYNWNGQPERLIYIGKARYPSDGRHWYQFAKVENPDVVWSEVLEYELQFFEETDVPNVELTGREEKP